MKRYTVRSAFDLTGPVLGTLVTQDDGTLVAWESDREGTDGMFSDEIDFGQSLDNVLARYRTFALHESNPNGDSDAP